VYVYIGVFDDEALAFRLFLDLVKSGAWSRIFPAFLPVITLRMAINFSVGSTFRAYHSLVTIGDQVL